MKSSERTQCRLALLVFALLLTNAPSVGRSADLPDAVAAGWKGQKTCELLDEYEQVRVLRCTFPQASAMNATLIPKEISAMS
jgi:hypothetical protein